MLVNFRFGDYEPKALSKDYLCRRRSHDKRVRVHFQLRIDPKFVDTL